MESPPLALTDAQLVIVLAGARAVPPDQRGYYLATVVHGLRRGGRFTDDEVAAAVEQAKFRFGVQL
jgi:hypothetical protein